AADRLGAMYGSCAYRKERTRLGRATHLEAVVARGRCCIANNGPALVSVVRLGDVRRARQCAGKGEVSHRHIVIRDPLGPSGVAAKRLREVGVVAGEAEMAESH